MSDYNIEFINDCTGQKWNCDGLISLEAHDNNVIKVVWDDGDFCGQYILPQQFTRIIIKKE